MAITQRDIKKVLAYSTLSQLGYMIMALGCGAYTAAMFHLTTHAFFKALLFLGAGSRDPRLPPRAGHVPRWAASGKPMPTTWRTWVDRHAGPVRHRAASPASGRRTRSSAPSSHAHGVGGHTLLWIVGTVVAGLTAFYMGRATILTFFGSYRGHAHPHESPKLMTWPLMALALVSLGIGFIGLPAFGPAFGGTLPAGYHGNWIERFLHAWHVGGPAELHLSVALISLGVAGLGLWLAWRIYGPATQAVPPAHGDAHAHGDVHGHADAHGHAERTAMRATATRAWPALVDPLPARLGGMWTTWDNLWYVDRFYLWLVKTVQQGFARLCWLFERWVVIQLLYNGTARLGRLAGERLRRLQDGRLVRPTSPPSCSAP